MRVTGLLMVVVATGCSPGFLAEDAVSVGYQLRALSACPAVTGSTQCPNGGSLDTEGTPDASTLGFSDCLFEDGLTITTATPLAVSGTCTQDSVNVHISGELEWLKNTSSGQCSVELDVERMFAPCTPAGDLCEATASYRGTICDFDVDESCTMGTSNLDCTP
jgi:hypothetical protein